jgi:2,3-bisphosphoglycerate-dependent phosphoglycerate mutase
MTKSKVILLRHGQSQWNLENKFTGWTDVPLSEAGEKEAVGAGELIRKSAINIDLAYSSVLERCVKTLGIVLKVTGLENIPQKFSWRLNERHYGALQGLNKKETTEKYGEEQTALWRRSYATRPPSLDSDDPRNPTFDQKYSELSKEDLPLSESLADTEKRVMVLWRDEIEPKIKDGKNILVVLCGNACRGLVKQLDGISDSDISALNIPTGQPLVYEFDELGQPIKHYYLASDEEIAALSEVVKNQSKI